MSSQWWRDTGMLAGGHQYQLRQPTTDQYLLGGYNTFGAEADNLGRRPVYRCPRYLDKDRDFAHSVLRDSQTTTSWSIVIVLLLVCLCSFMSACYRKFQEVNLSWWIKKSERNNHFISCLWMQWLKLTPFHNHRCLSPYTCCNVVHRSNDSMCSMLKINDTRM
jgi:hypothetical protein